MNTIITAHRPPHHRPQNGLRGPGRSPRAVRGVATLAIVTVLVLAAMLAVAQAGRLAGADLRAAASQARATAAFEAAEGGLAWALEGLNSPQRVDAACRPSARTTAPTVRDLLVVPGASPTDWQPTGRELACRQGATGDWQCACGGAAASVVGSNADSEGERPSFRVRLQAGDAPGTLRLVARGCSHAARPCLPDAAQVADATAEVQVQVRWLQALARTPVAALTARGAVALDGGFKAVNADPDTGGLTVHAGGPVHLAADVAQSTPGTPGEASVAADDPALRQAGGRAIDADSFFMRLFGLGRERLQALPGLLRLDCRGGCSAERLRQALSRGDTAMVWIDGDLTLDDAGALGTPERPVLLVVDGALQWPGSTRVHGVVHHAGERLIATSGAVRVHGALVAEGDVDAAGPSTITHDAVVLRALARRAGAFVSLPGSWRDFNATTTP